MSDVDEKSAMKKLSARAMQSKMDLHDLSEELPLHWERILEVAERAHCAFRELDERKKLASGK